MEAFYVLRVGETAARLSYELAVDSFCLREKAEAEAARLNDELSRVGAVVDTLLSILTEKNLEGCAFEAEFNRLAKLVHLGSYQEAALLPHGEEPWRTSYQVHRVVFPDE
jgi:hypothetical protein